MYQIKKQNGFTIVETLIVLAVTGVFFISTATLIQGQVEKNRYQDSMRQLPQMIQSVVNDVSDGYMASSPAGTSDVLLVGKKFWFCGDGYNSATPLAGCKPNNNDGNILYTATITQNPSDPTELLLIDQNETRMPGGLKFSHFRYIEDGGNLIKNDVKEFGSQVMFTDNSAYNPNVGSPIGLSLKTQSVVGLFSREGLTMLQNQLPANGRFLLCFEGLHYGSIELGGKGMDTQTVMNMNDEERCK